MAAKFVSDYFAEEFNFGGELMTRASIYQWHKENGYDQRAADMWLMGASLPRYAVKCDDCKEEMRRTADLGESAAGGRCEECRLGNTAKSA